MALLLIPSSLQTVNLETYPLENFVEGIYAPLTDQVVDDLRQHAVIENNHLTYTGNTNWEQVTFGDTVSSSSDFTYQFANQSLTIRKGSDILSELTYEGLNTDDFASKETLTAPSLKMVSSQPSDCRTVHHSYFDLYFNNKPTLHLTRSQLLPLLTKSLVSSILKHLQSAIILLSTVWACLLL